MQQCASMQSFFPNFRKKAYSTILTTFEIRSFDEITLDGVSKINAWHVCSIMSHDQSYIVEK